MATEVRTVVECCRGGELRVPNEFALMTGTEAADALVAERFERACDNEADGVRDAVRQRKERFFAARGATVQD